MSLIGGIAITAPAWHKPVINAVILPAHAQTSCQSNVVTIESLDSTNPFGRYIVLVDSADNVVANCGSSGGLIVTNPLADGVYRVFSDTSGSQNHTITITSGCNVETVTIPSAEGTCNFLVATITLPSNDINPEAGQQINGSWDCSTNTGLSCANG